MTDNTALLQAAGAAGRVIPVFVQSVWRNAHSWTGPHRQAFLCGCLESLDKNLRQIGSRLVIRRGDAIEELGRLVRQSGAEAIYFNRDPDPHGRAVEERLRAFAGEWRVEARGFKDACLHERDEVLTAVGEPYRVFTPYAKAWNRLDKPMPSGRLRKLQTPDGMVCGPLPRLEDWRIAEPGEGSLEPGERAARARLSAFLKDGLARYKECRERPADRGASRLSQDLRFGLVSIREIYRRCVERARAFAPSGRESVAVFLNELAWREFYMQILWHWPEVLEREFNPRYRNLRWWGSGDTLRQWRAGETGFPVVDAAMRQLKATGFMHNRCRMITAMFLTKDLGVDWREGERYFMQQLTDGEIASNNGGWQWSAGVGADAAPYFRIQNPWTQSRRHDPEGRYIKTWVPELRDVAPERFFAPPADGGSIARDYPAPIADHAAAREKTLAMFRAVR